MVNGVLKTLDLSSNQIHDEGATAIGESLKTNSTLEELVLVRCGIGPAGGRAIGVGLQAGITALKKMVLSHNQIKDEGAIAIGECLKTNTTLEELELQPDGKSPGRACFAAFQLG